MLEFPDDPDGKTLTQLQQAGSNLTKFHTIEFFLYVPSRVSAESVSARVQGMGFSVELRQSEEGTEWLVLAKKPLVPEHETLRELREQFGEILQVHGGEYDGWGTPVVK